MSPLLRLLVPAVGLVAASLVSAPARAQEGVLMKQMLGNLGILPEDKDPIEYRERPTLVVPKDTAKLPPPEADATKANPSWPKDPDVAARDAARRQRNAPGYTAPANDPVNGARLSPAEMAKHRTTRDTGTWNGYDFSDKGGIRLSPQEMAAQNKVASEPSYPPGTEPPRKYLTDPPVGKGVPSSAAPIGSGRAEARDVGKGDRPEGAWKRLD
jgi:hypothetical protein